MSFESSLFTYLSAQTSLTALVSTRIYPVIMPQSTTMPAISYEKISHHRFSGAVNGQYGLCSPIYEFQIMATTYASVQAIATVMRSIFKNFSGTMGDIEVQLAKIISDDVGFDEKTNIYYSQIEFEFYYAE